MTRIQFRNGTAAQWTAKNPVLSAGEPGFVTDTGQLKIGDGTTAFGSIVDNIVFNLITIIASAVGNIALAVQVSGDTNPRFSVQGNGLMAWGPGNAGADTNLYRATTSILQTDSTLALAGVGQGLRLAEGANAKMGTATANGITAVTVSTTAVNANSRIYLTAQNPNAGTPGALYVSTITAGTSFQFKSSGAADASTVAWLIIDHV